MLLRRNASENSCGLHLQKLGGKSCQKKAKMSIFLVSQKKILVETQPHEQECFNDHQFCTFTAKVTPLATPFLKMSSQMDKNCRVQRVKSGEKWSKIDFNLHY